MRKVNWRSMRAVWRTLVRQRPVPLPGITVTEVERETHVEVEAVHPHLRAKDRHRYRLTTAQMFLDPEGFPSTTLRDNIARDAQKARHRAMYCWDFKRALTLAALSFHVDKRKTLPLVVTDIGIRQDGLNAESTFAFWMLLDYLQDIALLAPGRADDEVGAVAQDETGVLLLRQIGLSPCERPAALGKPGAWYCYRRTRPRA